MKTYNYIFRSLWYYLGRNLLLALGIAVSTAVLTGALIIGDSVRYSLEQSAWYRLGDITHAITVTDRYFRSDLANAMQQKTGHEVAPVLMLDGMAVADGGQRRVNKVQITGIDSRFSRVARLPTPIELAGNEVVISENMAQRLEVQVGDAILVRIAKASLIPKNAPFVSDTETSVTFRAQIAGIASKQEMGHFNLKNSQSSPYNLFMSLDRLNRLMEFEVRANRLLISGEDAVTEELYDVLNKQITPEDGGLVLSEVPLMGEMEVTSERVFMENSIVEAYRHLPGAKLVLTYFVNSLEAGNHETPYSFVTSLTDLPLSDNEIIVNEWTAQDLQVKPGDSVKMTYFEIGPLRQLQEKEVSLVVKEIVPIAGKWADGNLMPHLPGLSDAGHCREWEAGVPINLEKIRQKDEDYWDTYKGIPKAFISHGLAQKIWSNRYGNYTALRIPATDFTDVQFRENFNRNINPADIGFAIQPVREDGLQAARGGVDFSQLFLGLSFFLLLAAIILSVLLFRLNLEGRSTQTGTLMQLGFTNGHISKLIFSEAMVISFAGILTGIVLAVAYTQVVFGFLNTLWWDIVRTDVLLVKIQGVTLIIGGLVSLIVILLAISIPLKRYLKQRVAELHRQEKDGPVPRRLVRKRVVSILLPLVAVIILLWQLIAGEARNPMLFFAAGGLLLPGLLLWVDRWYSLQNRTTEGELTLSGLTKRNLAKNKNRSMTVIILFALGTFIVVSTGANRQDLYAGAEKKTSGAGGFQYFAETSVPVLYDLNDPARRLTEGLPEGFSAVQFHRVEGDDASCLNLNRISNPAILGVDPHFLKDRFSFVSRTDDLDQDNPWQSLEQSLDGGIVPAIADQTVIQWGLGMKIGDTLMYQNETGDTLRLKLIGGLAPSVFQGNIIIAGSHFLNHYPTHSGSSVFLTEMENENAENIAKELHMILRDYGWEMNSAPQRLAEFYSVTNTYLAIFLALGALGLALGTIGLALVLARTIIERQRELAILQAVGFRKRSIVALLVREYGSLLLVGVGIGFVTAVVSTLPAFFSRHADISFPTIAWVVALILLNGFIWIIGLATLMVKPAKLIDALRVE